MIEQIQFVQHADVLYIEVFFVSNRTCSAFTPFLPMATPFFWLFPFPLSTEKPRPMQIQENKQVIVCRSARACSENG
jgi:hypothetical protein